LDIDDCVPLTNLSGHKVGACRVRCRAWIDKMEPSPEYLSVDRERTLEEFVGKTCVLRLYFESLQDLPASLCASTFLNFKFFYHSKPYRTPRHGGASVNPYLNAAVRIDQKITLDFIDFVRRGSLEIEVFGKRRAPPGNGGRTAGGFWDGADGYWPHRAGEYVAPYVPPRLSIGDDDPTAVAEDEEAAANGEALLESMRQEIEDLTADLQAAERQLARASKISDAAQEENIKLQQAIHQAALKQQQHYEYKKTIEASEKAAKQQKTKSCTLM